MTQPNTKAVSLRAKRATRTLKTAIGTYYNALDAMTKTLAALVNKVAPHWAEIAWEGEQEYMDDGSYAYCLNRLWVVVEGGAKHYLCGDWTDWDRVLEDQAEEIGDTTPSRKAEQERIMDLGGADACARHQARALGVSVAFLRQVSAAGSAIAYRRRDSEGAFEFPRPRIASAA